MSFKTSEDTQNNLNKKLFFAVELNNENLIKELIFEGADVNAKDSRGRSLIDFAFYNCDIKTVKLLLDTGADINVNPMLGEKLLSSAIYKNDVERIDMLLKNGVDLRTRKWFAETPLHTAIKESTIEVIDFLIKNGAKINVMEPVNDYKTPIQCSVKARSLDVIKLLLDNGADPNLFKAKVPVLDPWLHEPETTIHEAISSRRYDNNEVVKLLIKYGTKLNIKDSVGDLPLTVACKEQNLDIVKILLENGVRVDTKSLNIAKKTNNYKIITLLNANLNKSINSDKQRNLGKIILVKGSRDISLSI